MTTTTIATPVSKPYDVFQPNGGMPLPPPTSAARRKEAKLEAQLEELFYKSVRRLLRGHAIKLAPTRKGLPDRLVLLPGGRMELVELKTETGRLSPAQRLVHDQLAQVGILVTVLYGEDQLLAWVAKHNK